AGAVAMDGAGDELLAAAALADEQDRDAGGGDPVDGVEQAADGVALADDVVVLEAGATGSVDGELALGDVEAGLALGERLGELAAGPLGAANGAAEEGLVAGVAQSHGGELGDGAGEAELTGAKGAAAHPVVEVDHA